MSKLTQIEHFDTYDHSYHIIPVETHIKAKDKN